MMDQVPVALSAMSGVYVLPQEEKPVLLYAVVQKKKSHQDFPLYSRAFRDGFCVDTYCNITAMLK